MSKPTSYQLLKDIHRVTKDLDDKWEKRMVAVEKRQDDVEEKVDTMVGKATIGILVLSVAIGTFITLAVDWIRGR